MTITIAEVLKDIKENQAKIDEILSSIAIVMTSNTIESQKLVNEGTHK